MMVTQDKTKKKLLRNSGIPIIGDVPWGTHFCQFYETPEDLLDILVPYFKAGLLHNEFCMWVTSEPLGVEEATRALKKTVPRFTQYLKKGQIEIVTYSQWYTKGGSFNQERVLAGWAKKLNSALKKGYDGLRLTGNTFWLEKKDWKGFTEYERAVDAVIGNYKMLAICTYSLKKCGASEIMDVVANHEFALIKRGAVWQRIENTARVQTKEALQESESRYRELVQNANSAIIRWKSDGAITFFNEYAQSFFGYRADEVIGKNIGIIVPKKETSGRDLSKLVKDIVNRPEAYDNAINENVCKDGRRVWMSWSNRAVRDSRGRVSEIFAVGSDFTERKAIEESLSRVNQHLKFAQAAAGAGTWDWDLVSGKLEWSEPLFRLFGLDPRTALATFDTWRSIVHPEDREAAEQRIKNAIKDRKPLSNEYRIVLASGQVRWINALGNTTYGTQGKPLRMSGICFDITERRKKEEELNKVNRALKALSDNNQALMRISDETEYLQEVCNIIIKDCGYKMAWIGLAENDKAKTVRPVAQGGFERGYLKTVRITWADSERGRGPTGTCIRTGKPVMCRDMLNDPDFAPWRNEALKRGYASSIGIPLFIDGKAFGAVTLYSAQPDPFSEKEVRLLSELANDISYGITALRTRAAHARAEEETKKAHSKTTNILQSITEAYIVFDRRGRFVELNRCAEDLLGKKTEELRGRTFKELFPDVKEKEFYRRFREAALTRQEAHFEAFSRLAGKWFEAHAYPSSEALAVYLHDITQRKRSEELLHETRDYLENLINYANAPIIVWDPDFRITRFNHAFEFLSGYAAADMLGKSLEILFPEESKNESIAKIERTLSGEQWESVEIPIRCQNGDIRTLLWNSANIYLPAERKLSATIAQGQDITERKRAEDLIKKSRDELEQRVMQRTADLIKAQKELMAAKRLSDIGALSATVAHELRNPLGVIRAAAFNVRRKSQNPELEKHLDRIDRKIIESDQIINNLLFYSRIKTPHFETVQLSGIIKEVAADAKMKYKGSDVILSHRAGALNTVVIEADPAQIYELFSNILNNAYEAVQGKQGAIEIRGAFDGPAGLAKISFRDNGCGIPEDILPKIREPFFTTKSQGTGLGLTVCYQVARLHGGSIEVESSQGRGSVFTVTLPVKPETEKSK